MRNLKTFVLGLIMATAALSSVPQAWASPLVPVVPSAPRPIGPSRGERAVIAATATMQEIASAAIVSIQVKFSDTEDTLGSLTASLDVHERAVRIAKDASKQMKADQKRGQKALKQAYKEAKNRVRDVGGTASDLANLEANYESQQRFLNDYGRYYIELIREIADAIHL